ncbi:MAG TPA: hypothetical protein VFF04_00035 [Candidatus Babeliales bacterium]|nr:hypothetical protein [Candidatus Babeliales bacterium]
MSTYTQESPQQSRTLLLIVSISLHIFVLMLLFLVYEQPEGLKELLRPRIHEATVLSQAPNPGPQVIFDNEPEQSAQTPPTSSIAAPSSQAMEQLTQLIENEPQEETLSEDQAPTSLAQPIELIENTQSDLPAHVTEQPKKSKSKKRNAAQTGPAKQKQQAAAALRQIAQGFMQSVRQDQGNVPKIQEDLDLLALQRFSTKVFTSIKQTVNSQQNLLHLDTPLHTEVTLLVTIDRKGRLIDFVLEHPFKNDQLRQIEQLLHRAVRAAGLYPPVPQSIKSDPITLRFQLKINGSQGFHRYELYTN